MNYKRIQIECSKNYAGKIRRNPFDDSTVYKESAFRWHKEYEIIYVENGSLQINKLDETVTVNAGEFCLINSEEVHSYSHILENTDFLMVNIRKNAVSPYVDIINNKIAFTVDNRIAYRNILKSLKSIYILPQYDGSVEVIRIKALLTNILYYLIKYCLVDDLHYIPGSSSQDFDYAKAAIHYMYMHYASNITLDEISKYVGLSTSHFSKYFKNKTNVTFSRYLRQIRLEKALMDMSQNGVSVKQAAENNGFPNVNSFIVSCKEICHRTPLEMLNLMLS